MIRSVKNNNSNNMSVNRKTPQSKSIFNVLAESDSEGEDVVIEKEEVVVEEIKPEIKEVKKEEVKEVKVYKIEKDVEEEKEHEENWQRNKKQPRRIRNRNYNDEERVRQPYVKPKTEFIEVVEETTVEDVKASDGDIGQEHKLNNIWYVWVHEIESRDWSPESYKIIYEIKNISEFWRFLNNIHKLNQWKYHFFLMKAHSHPTWEHTSNRNGGSASIRIDVTHSIDIIEQIVILAFNESLTEQINDINGICFAAKGSWSVVKIWNKDKRNNIGAQLPGYMKKIYPSISIKYKDNTPEY
jgi:hypothetical protein